MKGILTLTSQYQNSPTKEFQDNGILRQLVKKYMATVDLVRTLRDENVEFGGAGITVVEMDF